MYAKQCSTGLTLSQMVFLFVFENKCIQYMNHCTYIHTYYNLIWKENFKSIAWKNWKYFQFYFNSNLVCMKIVIEIKFVSLSKKKTSVKFWQFLSELEFENKWGQTNHLNDVVCNISFSLYLHFIVVLLTKENESVLCASSCYCVC